MSLIYCFYLNGCVSSECASPEIKIPHLKAYLLNWIKTIFHSSVRSGRFLLTNFDRLVVPKWSIWISVQGPHGPVTPISQKLSFIPKGNILSSLMLK